MPIPIPLSILLIGVLIAVACLMVLYIAANVLLSETRLWDLRNEIEHLQYDYQLKLHHSGSDSPDDNELGMVDIL